MTMLFPSALWFLGAISIPIVIHLLSRLRINKVEFSTVRFIKQLETSSIRKMKFQQILLLLLRMLVIACLVLMIAQPVTQGFMPGWLAAEQDARLILVIDNSASMNAKVGNQSFFEISKKEALGLLPSFNKETQITLAQTCPPKTIFKGQSNDPDLRASIQSIQPTVEYDNLWANLNHLLKDGTIVEPVKECVIFSDFMYPPDSTLMAGIPNFESWKFYFIQPGTVYDNLSIRSVSSLNRIKTMSQLVKLNTRIENSGELPKPNVPLELLFNDHRVGQVVSEIESGKEKEFQFQAYPANMGIVQGRVSLPKDNYDLDNNWFLSMSIMKQIRCGIIGANSDDLAMLEMVLRAIDPQRQFLSIESRIQPELNRLFLDDVDVALIHNPKNITEDGVKDLGKFLGSGGGVIWFQGNEDGSEFHPDIFEKIGFPFPEKRMNAGQGFFSTQIAGEYSDLLQDLQVRNLDSELPEVFNYIQTKLDVKQKVHWTLNNSDPLLIEFSKGSGSVFYFSTLLDLRWNDLPIRGMLIPLIYRLLVLTGTDEINTSSVKINEAKWISVEEKYLRHQWEIVSPSGKMEMIVPEYDREGINISSTDELGIYTVYSNGELFTSFPTRLHDQEYIQARFSQNDIESILTSNQIRWLTLKDEFSQVFLETRQGKALWKIFLALAIVFLLAESIIGRPVRANMKTEDS